jgi:hypothetical protein
MGEQLSFSLVDEVAPYFENETIAALCKLIDQKQKKGLRYDDLKIMLLSKISKVVDLESAEEVHRRAYEFAKHY